MTLCSGQSQRGLGRDRPGWYW